MLRLHCCLGFQKLLFIITNISLPKAISRNWHVSTIILFEHRIHSISLVCVCVYVRACMWVYKIYCVEISLCFYIWMLTIVLLYYFAFPFVLFLKEMIESLKYPRNYSVEFVLIKKKRLILLSIIFL